MPLNGEYEPSPAEWVRNQVEQYEGSGGREGTTMRGMPVIILTSVGARSGKVRKTPLMRVEHDGSYAVVASQGGAPTHPVWYHNLAADPHVELQDGPVRQDMTARELSGEERTQWWQRAVEAYPDYADYQRKTDRQIPVFVVEPAPQLTPSVMRADFDPAELGHSAFYRLLTAVVVPRPIAWVSTVSGVTGSDPRVDNLAPHSFFTVACTDPPIVQFTSVGRKDSLRNVEANREFVINLAPVGLFEQVNATGTAFPPEISEFDAVGLTREPSRWVRPWRVAESPVALECVLHATVLLGDSVVVLGRVVHAAVDTDVMAADGLPDVTRLQPLSRLSRDEWGTLGPIREITRIRYADWPGHYAGHKDDHEADRRPPE